MSPKRYVGLLRATGHEVNAQGYRRLVVGGGVGREFTKARGGKAANREEWEFSEATARWGMVVGVAVWDCPTGGFPLCQGPMTEPFSIGVGETFSFPAGEFEMSASSDAIITEILAPRRPFWPLLWKLARNKAGILWRRHKLGRKSKWVIEGGVLVGRERNHWGKARTILVEEEETPE